MIERQTPNIKDANFCNHRFRMGYSPENGYFVIVDTGENFSYEDGRIPDHLLLKLISHNNCHNRIDAGEKDLHHLLVASKEDLQKPLRSPHN